MFVKDFEDIMVLYGGRENFRRMICISEEFNLCCIKMNLVLRFINIYYKFSRG